ncbi:universal stress protein [Lusitaniella coriacea LEGE 07157]|uniref:Universal stress protein n=1 Tax=Lusitaniella coriacea LEGE 07157 TaxID=945747 RepID=A0A8J7DWW5_9CYAN|nr:universal stress protein [Lusitaniella coriacea]MBE9116592.1 universal stress protein [Lusitaniella coriacea LEGE 07157]
MFKTVLFPIDRSRESRHAVDVVTDLVKKYDSRLIILSVVEETSAESETAVPEVMSSAETVEKLLKGAQALFVEKGIQAEIMEREGMPSFTICDVADELDANLIIMGSRGMGLTEEGAAESVTNRVINLSPCPVLVVP